MERSDIFEAVVVSSDLDNRILRVRSRGGTGASQDAIYVGGWLSSMLGIRTSYIPPAGSTVYCIQASESMAAVVGCASPLFGGSPADSRTAAGGPALFGNNEEREKYRQGLPPIDLLEGEVDMTNLFDVGISLLTGMARLKASDGASVEVMLMDQMVRILSRNYEHLSPLGAFRITTDGDKPTLTFEATSREHETLGLDTESSEKAEVEDNNVEYPGASEQIENVLRSRLQLFAGYLGDFVSMWVSDPLTHLEDGIRALGKLSVHHGQDGTFAVQSVADISLERVVRTVVPVQTKRPEDPPGEEDTPDEEEQAASWSSPADAEDAWHAAYQMREYSRWLVNYYLTHRLRQSRCYDMVEADTESQPDARYFSESDRDKSPTADIKEVYACIRILRTGQIVLIDGDDSSITMANGNIHLSARKSIRLEAPEALELIGGRVNILSLGSMNISVARGGLSIVARDWVKALCEKGGMLFKTLTKTRDTNKLTANNEPTVDGTDDNEDIPAVHKVDGIILESAGKIQLSSAFSLVLTCSKTILCSTRDFFTRASNGQRWVDQLGKVTTFIGQWKLLTRSSIESQGNIVSNDVRIRQERKKSQDQHANHVEHIDETLGEWHTRWDEEVLPPSEDLPPSSMPSPADTRFDFELEDEENGVQFEFEEMAQSHTQRELPPEDFEASQPGGRNYWPGRKARMLSFKSIQPPLKEGTPAVSKTLAKKVSPTTEPYHLKTPKP